MTWSIETFSEGQTIECGRALASLLVANDVVLLSGDLGAGKTQLTKGIAAGLGVSEPVTSPTFNILLVHEGRIPLYHFDLYRLENGRQLEDLDYYGMLEAGGVAVVEWGDRFTESIPVDGLAVMLRIEDDTERRIDMRPLGPRGQELASDWAAACGATEGVSVVELSQ